MSEGDFINAEVQSTNSYEKIAYEAEQAALPKKRGRKPGSKNKPKEVIITDEEVDLSYALSCPCGARSPHKAISPFIEIYLVSEGQPEGLEAILDKSYIAGVSRLPSGGASIITEIGKGQPVVFSTVTGYEDIKKALLEGW